MEKLEDRVPLELPSHGVLARLAQDDPLAYEALRRELIESFIDSAPEKLQRRLRGLQFRIDGIRRISGSALGATLKVYGLMWESFNRLSDEISEFGTNLAGEAGEAAPESARVIEFRRPPTPEIHSGA